MDMTTKSRLSQAPSPGRTNRLGNGLAALLRNLDACLAMARNIIKSRPTRLRFSPFRRLPSSLPFSLTERPDAISAPPYGSLLEARLFLAPKPFHFLFLPPLFVEKSSSTFHPVLNFHRTVRSNLTLVFSQAQGPAGHIRIRNKGAAQESWGGAGPLSQIGFAQAALRKQQQYHRGLDHAELRKEKGQNQRQGGFLRTTTDRPQVALAVRIFVIYSEICECVCV
ncbi:hypothetical protein J3E68DRAFT_360657 [Trichoderma sp. SZMC 28012]